MEELEAYMAGLNRSGLTLLCVCRITGVIQCVEYEG